ncbi:MAG: hypothetical protein J5723_05470 [Ruminococcus sp.]|nr:hypothetical protein [Ruminococcus sp.]
MMTSIDTLNACKSIKGWEVTATFSVGGFEWLAFSKERHGKMIIISSQRTTIVDCNNGAIDDCEIILDEKELIAYCDRLPDEELYIAGQFGGSLPQKTDNGEKVTVKVDDNHIMHIYFTAGFLNKTLIYYNYEAYICGFSYDGTYFVIADDGGVLILKKTKD